MSMPQSLVISPLYITMILAEISSTTLIMGTECSVVAFYTVYSISWPFEAMVRALPKKPSDRTLSWHGNNSKC
ncbi:hypothetical protein HDV64DRAFT_248462 [Trichoderma sp. TUCIM 5745]